MACSEAQRAAHRANDPKSAGPKTEEGREASRRDALKHGLTGAGIVDPGVVPGEDAAEVARQAAAILVELAPDGLPTARLLAERVATLAVRLRRSARHEFAATAGRTRLAALDFDDVRRAEADRLFEAIDADGSNRGALLAMPEGLDMVAATLGELRAVAAAGGAARWSREHSARLVRCLTADVRDHAEALGRALVDGDLSGLDAGLVAIMDRDHVRGPWALDQVVGLIDAGLADLDSLRPGLDHASVARLRAEAIHLVLVDAEPETLLARKYEAATERSLYRALKEIRAARKPAPATPAEAAASASYPSMGELVRQADEMRRHLARVEPAPVAPPVPPLASSFPGALDLSAAGHKSTVAEAEPAPRGRSRYEDRRQRPRLGR